MPRGSEHGTRHLAGAVLLMRTFRLVLALAGPAVTGGASLAAQAVERTDAPARGVVRVTFDPRIMTWNDQFTDAGRMKRGEVGLTDRLSVSLMVPMVRVATRASLQLSSRGANLGVNPLVLNALGARGTDSAFFAQFDQALAQLEQQAAGCASPCAARDSSTRWRAVRDALYGSVYGAGQTGSPFLPLDSSTAGKAIDTTVARI